MRHQYIRNSATITEQILNNTQEGIIVLSQNLDILYWNRFLEEFTKKTVNEVIGKSIFDIFPLFIQEKFKELCDQLFQGNKIEPIEYFFDLPLINKSGWCLSTFCPMYDEEGKINSVLITVRDITEQKRILESRHEKEELYKTIFRTSPDAIVLSNLDGYIIDANEGFCKQMGYTYEEVIGKTSLELNLWNNYSDRIYFIEILLETGIVENYEFCFNTKSGKKQIRLVSASLITVNKEKCIILITRDITKRKEIEHELQQVKNENYINEYRYKLISENISDVLWILDPSIMQFTYMSPSIKKLRGYEPDEVINTNLNSLFTQESAKKIISTIPEKINNFIKDGDKQSRSLYEFEIMHKDGHIIWVEIATQILKYDNGKIEIIGVTRNIDERKQAEAIIKESEMRYKTAFRTSPDGINIATLDGFFVDINDGFVTNMGYSKEEVIGKHSTEIPLWVNKDECQKYIHELQNHGSVANMETEFRHKDGTIMTALISANIILINNKPHVLSITRDITERKQMEIELIKAKEKSEESDKLKSTFLANMSHEIRTPMNAIKGFAELLLLPDLSEEKKQKFIDIINKRTDDLLMLINDLLDISRIEAGQLSIKENKGNINDLFNDLMAFFTSSNTVFVQANVELKYINDLEPNDLLIYLDFFRLKQVLINLISNALKFTKNGYVRFGCKLQDESTILFHIEDSGIGIPLEKHEIIFERFRQASDEHTPKLYGGTGLGLSIVKGIVELMKGKVWCTSQEGSGSIFYISLPFKPVVEKSDIY